MLDFTESTQVAIRIVKCIADTALIAVTSWYEAYYDIGLRGRYLWKVQELHEKYGNHRLIHTKLRQLISITLQVRSSVSTRMKSTLVIQSISTRYLREGATNVTSSRGKSELWRVGRPLSYL